MAFKSLRQLVPATAMLLSAGVAAAEPYRIVGFGDSLMAGYRLGPDQGFPAKLQAALRARGHDVEVADAGVSGDTTSGGLSRLDWSVPDGTEMVILELGANDMLRGVSPGIVEKNLDTMIGKLRNRGIKVLLAGMYAAPSLGRPYGDAFNAIFPRLAKKYDVPLYPFFLDGVALDPTYLLDDRAHPNAKGIDRMVERVLPSVEAFLIEEQGKS